MATRPQWEVNEHTVAQLIGGRVTHASGRTRKEKGDVVNDTWVFEVKSSQNAKIVLNVGSLKKIVRQSGGRDCGLVVFCKAEGLAFLSQGAYDEAQHAPPESLVLDCRGSASVGVVPHVWKAWHGQLLITDAGVWEICSLDGLRDLA